MMDIKPFNLMTGLDTQYLKFWLFKWKWENRIPADPFLEVVEDSMHSKGQKQRSHNECMATIP